MTASVTTKEALAKLKREFQLAPTRPEGGISVPPSVALGLCNELSNAVDVIDAARRIVHSARMAWEKGRAYEAVTPHPQSDMVHLERMIRRFDKGTEEEQVGQ